MIVEMLPKYRTALRIPSVSDHLIIKHMQAKETCFYLTSLMSCPVMSEGQ